MSNKSNSPSSIKRLIESLVFQSLLEFRSKFKWNDFKGQSDVLSATDLIHYVEQTGLPFLGKGSSRVVFALPNTKYVLKLAKNQAGFAQNKAEVDVYTNPKTKNIVAQVFDWDSEYDMWIVSETVKEFRDGREFLDAVGIELRELIHFYDHMKEQGNGWYEKYLERAKKRYGDKYENNIYVLMSHRVHANPFSKDFANLVQAGDLMEGDLGKPEHWGKTADGRVVILDYGYTKSVHRNYYS